MVDSEFALSKILDSGYQIVEGPEEADIGIVNTCGFIEEAKEEAVDVILDLLQFKKEGRLKKVVIGGCLTQRYAQKIFQEIPEASAVLGINWEDIDEVLNRLDSEERVFKVKKKHRLFPYQKKRNLLTPSHYAYLKISEGCLNKCSYCAIPNIKGSLRSREMEDILQEAEGLVARGVRELNIVAQDTTSYGMDIYGVPKIVELIEKIHSIKGNFWIRLLYTNPLRIGEELIRCYKELPKLCKYVDVPLQHISNKILKAMQRGIDKKNIYNLIEKLRKEIEGVFLRTTLMVGFPGESEKEFEELIEFVKEVRFERLGCFVYSREEGTPAYRIKEQVPLQEKNRRFDLLMSLQKEIAGGLNRKLLGRRLKLLIDAEESEHYIGRTEYDAPEVDGVVYLQKAKGIKIGEFRMVKIKDCMEYDLLAECT